MECPNCEKALRTEIRKEKYKSITGIKLAINLNVYVCDDCEAEFIDEEEQRIYQAKCKNFVNKVENSIQ